MRIPLGIRKLIGNLSNWYYPATGTCGHCNRNWRVAQEHSTLFLYGHSCFPLCEMCWRDLSIAERLPHYEALYNRWASGPFEDDNGVPWPEVWGGMKKAVMAGL